MPNDKIEDRAVIADAIASLKTLTEKNELPAALMAVVVSVNEAAKTGVLTETFEACEGTILVLFGEKGSHHIDMAGGFNPVTAYGVLVDGILDIFVKVREADTEKIVKSFVGDIEASAAQIQKAVTNPTDH